ncbi:MAG: ribokinase [Firmicutes bacterium]|nr:ribokinase [Bacillota bacterium]
MKVVGMGDNVVDRYINKRIMFPGGNAVNFAVYAEQCGADSAYLGVIADDKEGRLVYDSLKEIGVDVSCSPLCSGLATERCDVLLEEGDRVFQGCSYGEGEYRTLVLSDEAVEYLKGFELIHCGCYGCMEDEMKKLRDFSAVRTYDFSAEAEYRTDEYLEKVCPYIDIALFSAEEMDRKEAEKLRETVTALGTKLVLITKGAKGQSLWDGSREYPGLVKLVEPVDTMGAGDSFFTAFVIALMNGGYGREKAASEEMIKRAFEFAADFSAKTCLAEGAFGFGTAY